MAQEETTIDPRVARLVAALNAIPFRWIGSDPAGSCECDRSFKLGSETGCSRRDQSGAVRCTQPEQKPKVEIRSGCGRRRQVAGESKL